MRLSMKSLKPFTVIGASSSHVTQKQHCSCSAFTQQLSFNSLSQHCSPKNWQGFLDPVQPANSSPTARLGNRWMEYQGVADWAGLLDPLDDGLRSEILRYGNFVEAAYRAFEFDPSSPSYGGCKYPKKSLLEETGCLGTGYQLTKHLRATSGIQLPSWAGPILSMQSSWVGYVGVCDDRMEIDRLGRRDVVISLRGTATCLEWLENLRATLAPIAGPSSPRACNVGPMVETGFLSLYTSGTDAVPSLQETIRQEVSRILEVYPDEPLSFTFTGHSLGAALATLAAYDIKTTFKHSPLVTVVSFGGPRVGNRSFRSLIDKQGTKILRIVNPSDLITKVPGFVIDNNDNDYENDNNNNNNNNNNMGAEMHPMAGFWPSWIQKRVEDTQWVYAEVGSELRLTSQEPEQRPFYLSNMNLAKCHDLKTYLELVRGLSSNCPIRSNSKKLLNKQRLYHNETTPATLPATT